jgi:hypothetical protein
MHGVSLSVVLTFAAQVHSSALGAFAPEQLGEQVFKTGRLPRQQTSLAKPPQARPGRLGYDGMTPMSTLLPQAHAPHMWNSKTTQPLLRPTLPGPPQPLLHILPEDQQMEKDMTQVKEGWKRIADKWTKLAARTSALRGAGMSAEWAAIEEQARATAEEAEAMVPWWGERLNPGSDWTQIEEMAEPLTEAANAWRVAVGLMPTIETEGWRAEVAAAIAIASAARATAKGQSKGNGFTAPTPAAWLRAAQGWDATAESITAQAAVGTEDRLLRLLGEGEVDANFEGMDDEKEWLKAMEREKARETARLKARGREMTAEWKAQQERDRQNLAIQLENQVREARERQLKNPESIGEDSTSLSVRASPYSIFSKAAACLSLFASFAVIAVLGFRRQCLTVGEDPLLGV